MHHLGTDRGLALALTRPCWDDPDVCPQGLLFIQSRLKDSLPQFHVCCWNDVLRCLYEDNLLVSSESPFLFFLLYFSILYSVALICYKGKAVEENKTNIKKYSVKGFERWRNDESERA